MRALCVSEARLHRSVTPDNSLYLDSYPWCRAEDEAGAHHSDYFCFSALVTVTSVCHTNNTPGLFLGFWVRMMTKQPVCLSESKCSSDVIQGAWSPHFLSQISCRRGSCLTWKFYRWVPIKINGHGYGGSRDPGMPPEFSVWCCRRLAGDLGRGVSADRCPWCHLFLRLVAGNLTDRVSEQECPGVEKHQRDPNYWTEVEPDVGDTARSSSCCLKASENTIVLFLPGSWLQAGLLLILHSSLQALIQFLHINHPFCRGGNVGQCSLEGWL